VGEWFDQAIRAHEAEHGPSGGAWNISMILERLHRSAPSLPDNVGETVATAGMLRERPVSNAAIVSAADLLDGAHAALTAYAERVRVLESDCAFLLSVIESCDEAEAPSYEMDPEDTARIALIRSELKESAADT
jgi:hypothetical protein